MIRIANGEGPATLVQGFDVSGGDTAQDSFSGGCVHVSGASVTLRDLVVHGCRAHLGGGIWLNESEAWLKDVELSDNLAVADSAGDWGYGGGLYTTGSTVTIQGLDAHGNGAGRGGGLMFGQSATEAEGLIVEGNSADRGARISVLGGSLLLVAPWLADNVAESHSGGLWVNLDGELSIDDDSSGALSDPPDASGCGCQAGGSGGWLVLLPLGILIRRRRGRR